jgi:uncharacterized protein YndB with AHSA1/START domain
MSTAAVKKSPTEFRAARVELEVRIDAPPQRVWDAMIKQTSRWWRKDFYTNPRTQDFHIEPRLGGRMYEDWGSGDGLVWATVVALETPRMILLSGHLTPQFGGPAHTLFEFRLDPAGDGATLVKITDNIFGNISEDLSRQMHEGWTLLFAGGLKPFVESNR